MKPNRKTTLVLSGVCALGVAGYQLFLADLDRTPEKMLSMVVTRLLGAVIFALFLRYLGYRTETKTTDKAGVITLIGALVIALNNAPWIALLTGKAASAQPVPIWFLAAAECLSVGLFEEIAFRGVFFLRILENRRSNRRQIFLSLAASSALFALIHLVNLLEGASPYSVLLQIGYSFLIGGMCGFLLLESGKLWLCVLVHALFDFGGVMISTLLTGEFWDIPTVVLTAVLSVAMIGRVVFALTRFNPEKTNTFYGGEA